MRFSLFSWISPRKWKYFRKYFSMWIQGPGTIDAWKTWVQKSHGTVPLNLTKVWIQAWNRFWVEIRIVFNLGKVCVGRKVGIGMVSNGTVPKYKKHWSEILTWTPRPPVPTYRFSKYCPYKELSRLSLN